MTTTTATTTPTTCPEWCRDHGREHTDAGGEIVHTWGRSADGELEVQVSRIDIHEPGEVHSEWWVGFNQDGVDVLDLTGHLSDTINALQRAEEVLTGTGARDDNGGDVSLYELARVACALGVDVSVLLYAAREHKAGRFEVPLDPTTVEAVREALQGTPGMDDNELH